MISDELPARVDTVIVGAGIAGLACAYQLLKDKPGMSVLVLEAGEPGSGASGRTTGMVTPGIGQDFAGVVKRLGVQQATHLYEQTLGAVRRMTALVREEEIDCDFETTGQLVVAHGKHGEARLARQMRAFEICGLPVEKLAPAALAERVRLQVPPASNGRALSALHIADAAVMNPLKFLHGLSAAIRRRGGRIVCNANVVAVNDSGKPVVQLASGQRIDAASVVLATASESLGLSRLAGRVIPISLNVLVTQPLSGAQLSAIGWQGRECIIDSRQLFNYFRLTPDQRIVFGGGAPAYGHAHAGANSFADLERELRETFPGGDRIGIAQRWSGTIDYTLDGLPVVASLRRGGSVIYAGGFCGHGVAMSLLAANSVSSMIAGGNSSAALSGLRRHAPLIPGEWLRKICFSIASGWMRYRGT